MNLMDIRRRLATLWFNMSDWWTNPPVRIHICNPLYDIDHVRERKTINENE